MEGPNCGRCNTPMVHDEDDDEMVCPSVRCLVAQVHPVESGSPGECKYR